MNVGCIYFLNQGRDTIYNNNITYLGPYHNEAFHLQSPLRFVVSICGTVVVVNYMAR